MASRVFLIALLAAAVPRTALGDEPNKRDGKSKRETNDADIMLGGTFDRGFGPYSQGSTSLGVRIARVHLAPAGLPVWLGYGGDARVVTTHFDSVDAGLVNLVARLGVIGPTGFVELEGLIGLGIAGMPIPTWGLAVLFGLPWFGVGVSGHFPIAHERPVWLEETQLAIRLRPARTMQVAIGPLLSRSLAVALGLVLGLAAVACRRAPPPPKTWQGAIQFVEEATGTKATPWTERERPPADVVVFRVDDGLSIVERDRMRVLDYGAYLFLAEHGFKREKDTLGLAKTTDKFKVVQLVGTDGINYDHDNADVITWLRQLDRDEPFVLTGAGFDYIEG